MAGGAAEGFSAAGAAATGADAAGRAHAAVAAADLRAAVAAGVLDERQASRLAALAEARSGRRAAIGPDEEPFELFRGMGEVFVALGVALLGAGVWLWALASGVGETAPQLAAISAAWIAAEYLTRRRRMALPSLLLAFGVAAPAAGVAGTAALNWMFEATPPGELGRMFEDGSAARIVFGAGCAGGVLGAGLFHLRFRLPFALFLMAVAGFGAVMTLAGMFDPMRLSQGGVRLADLFDLGAGAAGLATLGYGLAVFAAAMAFDTADPHRVTRLNLCAFWLHLVAAAAIVNTLAVSVVGLGAPWGQAGLGLAVLAMTVVALVIDRRSFLTASLAWLWVLARATVGDGVGPLPQAAALVALGGFIVAIGSGWARLRAGLMDMLPDFPGKDRLPPWAGGLDDRRTDRTGETR
ncbi:hypothetical protein [Rubrimonas cliftonensis]|uniref:DUF2157 domain-containing protein n=1 Tax=Rubrimonas cliftonensis TaxID=89524 RepID=A0A1H4D8E1_9RHOB|nr:hypothetical protein [Rubrimonas cliftonensis]SEA68961.1 hypothetical protein SAMN05444370_10996 [Rubrimonas cliftonensis]